MAEQVRFAVMGTGGVGGGFGARLARAGFPVSFVARGAHLAAIREAGLRVEGPEGGFTVRVPATDDPAEIGPVDFVLFTVKLWDTEAAAEACRPLIGPETAVVCLQNGVEGPGMIAGVLGAEHVIGGVAEISAVIEAPGVIRQVSDFCRIRFGEMDDRRSDRAARLGAALAEAGIEAEHVAEIERSLWLKFVFLTGHSALTALTRARIGAVRANPETRALLRAVVEEAVAVGQARGVRLSDADVDSRFGYYDALPAEMRASMAVDLERGNRLELPWLSGAVVRLGEAAGVATPANRFVEQALALEVMGRPAAG
jgi:2-dehydropantoate 2-reductase